MPQNMNSYQKKAYARYVSLYTSYLSDGITPDQRERCKTDMIAIEKEFGIEGDWN